MDIVQRLWTNDKDLSAGIYVGADAGANLFFHILPSCCMSWIKDKSDACDCLYIVYVRKRLHTGTFCVEHTKNI